MSAAIAVILFLNGVQISLPMPAAVMEKQTWVPVRAVFERLGYEVRWDGAAEGVKLSAQGRADVLLRVGDTKVGEGKKMYELSAAPRRIEGTTYAPAQLLSLVAQAQLRWDNQQKALYIDAMPAGKPTEASVADILSDPLGWANKLVTIAGEYTGWQADPFSLATTSGPPMTRSDWTICDATGSIYCTADELRASPMTLQPYTDLGRRIQVIGTVRLAKKGFPYLRVREIKALAGLNGVTCYLTTNRRRYQPGDTVVMQMKVGNPTKEPITLQFASSKTYDFTIRDQAGQEVWRWSAGKMFTQALQQRVLSPQASYLVEARWTVPFSESDSIQPGLYEVQGEITREIASYPHTIQIRGQQ